MHSSVQWKDYILFRCMIMDLNNITAQLLNYNTVLRGTIAGFLLLVYGVPV